MFLGLIIKINKIIKFFCQFVLYHNSVLHCVCTALQSILYHLSSIYHFAILKVLTVNLVAVCSQTIPLSLPSTVLRCFVIVSVYWLTRLAAVRAVAIRAQSFVGWPDTSRLCQLRTASLWTHLHLGDCLAAKWAPNSLAVPCHSWLWLSIEESESCCLSPQT